MNLILGIVAGGLIGWLAFAVLKARQARTLQVSLIIGVVGGVLGTQLAAMFGGSGSSDAQLDLFSLATAAAGAGACLIIANMIASRRSA
jgi:uncharacterized membrane protein YeaQ/YmgE (transglycosylase-associated protein family)